MTSFLSSRQRGIYSEIVNPENASQIKFDIKQGPSESLIIKVNQQQKPPKAFSIQHRMKMKQLQSKMSQLFKENEELVTVDPKVMEPYDPIPGRVPRKVAIDRKRKEFASFNLEELLLEQGIDYNKPNKHSEWLPLELFDDTTYDDYSSFEWINKAQAEASQRHVLLGKALVRDPETNKMIWRPVILTNYDAVKDVFQAKFLDADGNECDEPGIEVTRINVCLDAEDPRKFARRVANAHQQRIYADSLIRYNYYIDNMPNQDLNELDTEQRKRLDMLAKTKKLEQMDTTQLLMEVNNDYERTMNKIIFDKYLAENEADFTNPDLFPVKLILPPDLDQEKPVPFYGMVELERTKGAKELTFINEKKFHISDPKDFTEIFKDFCFASLYIKEEVIKALQLIRMQCNNVLEMEIFNFKELPETLRLEEFKHIQDSSTSQILYHLKGAWVNELESIIKKQFEDVGKGWFNMKETSKITYDFGKLKRFLTVVRLMMQDTLLMLIKRCYYNYFYFLESYVPHEVIIQDTNSVKNIYHDELLHVPSKNTHLLSIDLHKTVTDDEFVYSTRPQNYVQTILTIFDKALEEMAKVNDLEPRILKDLFTQNNEAVIKAPMKPRERPKTPQTPKKEQKQGRGKIYDENKWVWDLYESLKKKMEQAIEPLDRYLEKFKKFKKVLDLKPDDYTRAIEMEDPPREVDSIKEEILKVMSQEAELKKMIPENIHVSMFNIQCSDLLAYLTDKYSNLRKNLIDLIAKKARESTHQLFNTFEAIKSKISEVPKDIEKLTEIKDYIVNLPTELEKIKLEINKCLDIYKTLEDYNYRFTADDMNKRWMIFGGPKEVLEIAEKRDKQLEKDKVRFQEGMKTSQEDFKGMIENLERTIQGFHQHQSINDHENIAKDVASVNEQLIKFQDDAKKFNNQEDLFGIERTDYNKLFQMSREFQPYSNLWLTTHKWKIGKVNWMTDPWPELNAVEAEKFVDDGSRSLQGVIRFFRDKALNDMLKIGQSIKGEIDEFKPKVPLMVALRKKGMYDRHWNEISQRVGFEVKPTEDFTFEKLLDMGLLKFTDICVEVGEKAAKEYNIETMLSEMYEIWKKINFHLLNFKDKPNVFIIRGYDEIQAIVDEHIVNTQAMQFSPFKKPFEEEIIKWNTQLKTMSDILEEWAKCQAQWMYLQPIFEAPDIAKQLPTETKKFKAVDSTWKHTMNQAHALKNVLQVCTTEGLLERLQEANKNLEMIQKELNNYLEKKREKFARFYFLSNDDLLEILSQTTDPTAVQPHLKKVFENIFTIDFNEHRKIIAMNSAEKEKVKFAKIVDPNNKKVEDWMGEVEDMMKKSVREALLRSIQTYPTPTRTEWVRNHPGQCVLNGSQVHWTSEVEGNMKTKGMEGVNEYYSQLQVQLNDLVELVRQKLTKQQQVTLNALIVIDVHAKDVVAKLVKNNVDDIGAFEWISQLRYYWENEDCYVKCIQTNFPYGYEYLGNTLRLVITPLTDKCYMTLMGALKLNLGGAPAGPAGTGKTESTKDLAKALAKQCVVFNCSDSMDYLMLGKFFKGLASAGAWCCFDEFNRINIEVLSVIAQQLLTLFREKAKGTPNIPFEGSVININPTFCVFITMNPGYAGRTELPDNLKALFRSVAMMVPNYELIGEIMLYSFGFKLGRELARKMVATFKLSSEQLSSQDHYDYGMRAVRSVINAAGLLKSAEPDMDEDKLLLRALRDVNVPKFLKDDLPLFESIIKDLFPGVERPRVNYGDLLSSLQTACKKLKLQPVDSFIDKVIQLYDTIQVRHGLMLVGPTGGGKTCNYRVLAEAMTALHGKDPFRKVWCHILNPKSINMGQLYGEFNEQTHEWTDGILAYIVRETVKDQSDEKHWIIFDGPVDSLWIESMNTVLDDNKKLCLSSGQILTMTPYMTMMFEVEDLAVASPATVSRCGMVYMEPSVMGYGPLIECWIDKLPDNFKTKKSFVACLRVLFGDYLDVCLEYLKKNLKELVPTSINNLTSSLMKIMDCFLADYKETEIKKISPEEIENVESMLEGFFIFSLVWSVGCVVDFDGRVHFNRFLRERVKEKNSRFPFPEEKLVYDYSFAIETKTWQLWSEFFKDFQIDSKLQYHEIMIPTNDSTRNKYLIRMLITNRFHVLCPGPTGTGKSQNIYSLLTSGLNDEYQYVALTFSAQTSANQTQDSIDSKMEKRRKGHYGPPVGKKCILFVDDLNMPKKEQYGAQPPLELLRQYLDHGGWYNRKELSMMKIEDVILLSAMGPPGGGRSHITGRLVRHFNMLTYTELDEHIIKQIFNTIVTFTLKPFSDSIKKQIDNLIDNTLIVYNTVRNEMLPTPSKSHYTFNLRDIWKVFQGICSASNKFTLDGNDIIRLWFHENLRVFHDRLTTEEDRIDLKNMLFKQMKEKFQVEKEAIIDKERILYGDFWHGREVDPRHYCQITDLQLLLNKMETFQDDYNADSSFVGGGKKAMKLVMFLDACEHISRIARILRQPQGNALLLGIGGSGRQSLAKMATFICNYKLFQIEVIKSYNMRIWRDDIKKVLFMAGIDNKPVTFLFVDTQIINEQMLEDLNNILNSGDVTNIYNDKDMEEIMMACKGECVKKNLQPNKMNIFTQYLQRVRKNIHLVVAMSPLGNAFVTRLRMFPSMVNCCTIDWFTEWPEEALIGVGKGALIDYEQDLGLEGQIPLLVDMFKSIHKSVEKISLKFLSELRRHNYVTPTSYLELLTLFKTILQEKRNELRTQLERLKSGLDKLNSANVAVETMRENLRKMQPELEVASKDTEKYMEKLKVDKEEADVTQKNVAKEEAEASKEESKALELAAEATEKVAKANIDLERTLKEVEKLKKEHLVEIRAFANPPSVVKLVLQAVVILLIDKIKAKGGDIVVKNVQGQMGKKEEDYFDTAKKYLFNDPTELMELLRTYDRDKIKPSYILKIEQQCKPNPDFTDAATQKANFAIQFLFKWVDAMYNYHKIYTDTKPLRDRLEISQKIVQEKQAYLKIKKEELAKINAMIKELEDNLAEKTALKEDLTRKIKDCEIKLDRAQKLTEGLKEEKERWTRDIEELSKQFDVLAGNSCIAAGMVSYAGPFTAGFRQELEHSWIGFLDQIKINHSPIISMKSFLGDPVKIQSWNIAGLPKDDTSIENGIIIYQARRWSLMIDPQTQANKFIKNLGKEHGEGIDIIKLNDNIMRTLELAVPFGKWVLLENIGTELDPALDPILSQQFVKSGSGLSITIGDKNISYNDKFKFFMTTTIPNPHYSPETSVKVTIINFSITPSGLEEQMLALIVQLENPNLEQKKIEIVRKNAEDKRQLLQIEDSILKSLSETKGDISDILMDENLINKLQTSKKLAAEINQRVKDSKITEEKIDEARESYRSVAFRASLLFFCILDLSTIDHMYQYSLQWFSNLFIKGVEESPPSNVPEVRLENLNKHFTYSLYENICRSLFEKHKLMFSLMLTVKILFGKSALDEKEWRYLLAGPTGDIRLPANPTEWISESSWPDIYRNMKGCEILEAFQGLDEHFMNRTNEFREIFDSVNPQDVALPAPWNEKLNDFQKLLILKAIRPDKLIPALQNWISDRIGKEFIIFPTFDLAKGFKDSSIITPLIFLLSAGSDPMADFQKFADEMSMSKRCDNISLGQGQGKRAEEMIRNAELNGGWVLLQNCHLSISWMPELEKICEALNDNMHKDFRLWLTSMPVEKFPISVLQNGVKMTLEPPKGLRANLLRTYTNLVDKELENCKKPDIFKKLLFGFALFHAIIQDRRKFGPIGWNIAYEFTNEDFTVCNRQLAMLLDEYDEVPYKVINFLGAEINYGGRVTDEKDVRLIKTILQTYICPEARRDKHPFSESGLYYSPPAGKQEDYLKYISDLPLNPSPEAFGLHENADITNAQNETRFLLETILSVQPRSTSFQGKSREDVIEEIAINVQKRTPEVYDVESIAIKYPTSYEESMNTVLVQELIRYNRLLAVMAESLVNVKKALRGKIVMSEELEQLVNSLYDNMVPKIWDDKGFLSMKPLSSWVEDLNKRINFLNEWIQKGTPKVFWIAGFFFPQAFITGTLQNFARKHVIAIDRLGFDFKVLDNVQYTDITEKPADGCYIYGMYLEGARWDYKKHIINESKPKELFCDLPLMHLVPLADREAPSEGIYDCPLYKVVSRRGTLSTTGHSTNFVMSMEMPSRVDQSIWVKAGVAAFLALRY